MDTTPRPALTRRRALALAAVAAPLLSLGLLAAAPAQAAAPTAAPASQSCWTDADTGAVQCFDAGIDPLAYIAEHTGAPVVAASDAASAHRQARGARTATTPSPDTVYALATVYDGINFSTPSMTYTTSDANICLDVHNFSSLGSWNDRIESFQGFNGCSVAFYRDINYGTLIFGPANSSTNMGSADNQASSLQIH